MLYEIPDAVHGQIEIQDLTTLVLPGADVPTYFISEDCGLTRG